MAAPNKTKAASTKDSRNNKPKSASGSVHAPTEADMTPRASPASGIRLIEYGSGKPNKAAYNREQERIKAEIEPLQVKPVRVVFVVSSHMAFPYGFCSCGVFCTFRGVVSVGCRRRQCPLVSEAHPNPPRRVPSPRIPVHPFGPSATTLSAPIS